MEFRVIDTRTNQDVTDKGDNYGFDFYLSPTGALMTNSTNSSNDLDYAEGYYKIISDTPKLKPLEWKEEKGFLVAYCFGGKMHYWLNLVHMDLRLFFSFTQIYTIDTSSYDRHGWESPLNYCKRIAAEHREKLVLGEME